jgi:hypothetical protein
MRKMMAIGGAVSAAALALTAGTAIATQPQEGATFDFPEQEYVLVDGHKVTYCHRTGSAKNPYVIVTSDIKSVNDLDSMTTDHQHHEQVGNGLGPDIIPISDLVKKDLKGLVPLELCLSEPSPTPTPSPSSYPE